MPLLFFCICQISFIFQKKTFQERLDEFIAVDEIRLVDGMTMYHIVDELTVVWTS